MGMIQSVTSYRNQLKTCILRLAPKSLRRERGEGEEGNEHTSLHWKGQASIHKLPLVAQTPDLPEASAPKARPSGPGPPPGASAGTEGRKGGR